MAIRTWSGLSWFYAVVSLLVVVGVLWLWVAGEELGTEAREKAEAMDPRDTAANTSRHTHHRYGFAVFGYRGGK